MRTVDLIHKTRSARPLDATELEHLVQGAVTGSVPDYQLAAWLMAVCWRGLSPAETAELTLAMARSGDTLDLPALGIEAVDKHSTGGIGDKVSMVVVPLVAATGVTVAKMSGRSLGHTGGTLDKLEAIPGLRVELSPEEFVRQARAYGLVISGQSARLAPADGKLYALRDVTATVESIPLIASSVMSKKLAVGTSTIVLDVKAGSGAFMPTVDAAIDLAQTMVDIGRRAGRRMAAVVSDMSQPLGHAVGNALEVREAIDTLRGDGPDDVVHLCRQLAADVLVTSGRASDEQSALASVDDVWRRGLGLAKFRQLVVAQGGDATYVDDPDRLPRAPVVGPAPAPRAGYVRAMAGSAIGAVVSRLGAGRERKGDPIDHAVGAVFQVRIGDYVEAGAPLATLHARSDADLARAAVELAALVDIGPEPGPAPRLIHARIH